MNTIGDRIKYLRKTHNVTQKELADATSIQRGNISNYEHNRFKPNAEATLKIAQYFGVDLEWLTTGNSVNQPDNATSYLKKQENDVTGVLVREVKTLLSDSNIDLTHSNLDTLLVIIRHSLNLYEELNQ